MPDSDHSSEYLDESMSDSDVSMDSFDRMFARWVRDTACEWCEHGSGFDMCNGRGKECAEMARYQEAQLCARLTYLCQDSTKLPYAQASLQTRIIALIERIHS